MVATVLDDLIQTRQQASAKDQAAKETRRQQQTQAETDRIAKVRELQQTGQEALTRLSQQLTEIYRNSVDGRKLIDQLMQDPLGQDSSTFLLYYQIEVRPVYLKERRYNKGYIIVVVKDNSDYLRCLLFIQHEYDFGTTQFMPTLARHTPFTIEMLTTLADPEALAKCLLDLKEESKEFN